MCEKGNLNQMQRQWIFHSIL